MNIQKAINDLDKLYESVIELDTPYMLRNDGKLISCKELRIHPYIEVLPARSKSIKAAFDYLIANGAKEDYEWFIQHSLNINVKNKLQDILNNNFSLAKLDTLLLDIRRQTNQEFCRVRTSGKFLGSPNNEEIYFRISSFGFNWFDLIWQLVSQNKHIIKYVTVCTDERAGRDGSCYTYRGIKLDHLPIEDFLTLPGQPVIEYYKDENKATTAINEELEFTFIARI